MICFAFHKLSTLMPSQCYKSPPNTIKFMISSIDSICFDESSNGSNWLVPICLSLIEAGRSHPTLVYIHVISFLVSVGFCFLNCMSPSIWVVLNFGKECSYLLPEKSVEEIILDGWLILSVIWHIFYVLSWTDFLIIFLNMNRPENFLNL
jgi:hypothetical protein